MNPSKNQDLNSTTSEGGEGSDQSMSDSWTVLDSSHFKDDGDLSDAESVEVLATDEPLTDDSSSDVKLYDPPSIEICSTSTVDYSKSTFKESLLEESDSIPLDPHGISKNGNDETASTAEKHNDDTIPPKKHNFFNGAPIEIIGESFSTILLELAIYSLIIDLFILTYFGFSSITVIFDKPGSSFAKMSSSHLQYEMDPLALQLSHVLAEWKKHPQEDHSLDRHVLKTLLLYYGGSTELSATLHTLSAKVQKHNEFIREKSQDWQMDWQRENLIVSGHIAHSVACILGNQDNDKSLPADLFMTVNNTNEKGNTDFSPEPTFWLNDWHLPQYFKANDTYYRVESKSVLPPMKSLYLNLGSAKWNHYFWKLYLDDVEGENRKNNVDGFQSQGDRITENELESEETERSPLDLLSRGDIISVEESSGNVQNSDENVEVADIYSQFSIDDDSEQVADVIEEKDQTGVWEGDYVEVLDDEDYLIGSRPYESRYVCLDDSCRPFKEVKDDEDQKPVSESKGKLSLLFKELDQDDSKMDEDPRFKSEWMEPNPNPDQNIHGTKKEALNYPNFNHVHEWNPHMDENPVSNDWMEVESPFEGPWTQLKDKPDQNQKKSKIVKLFEELSSEETPGENMFAGRYMHSPQNAEFGNLFGDIVQNNGMIDKKAFEHPKKGKLAMLFEELALEESLEQKKGSDKSADYPSGNVKSKVKRKYKGPKHDIESMKGKNKQKKKGKGKQGFENGNLMGKKKIKKRNNLKNDVKFEEPSLLNANILSKYNDKTDGKKNFEGKNADWNTRMAQGREKLRALSEKGGDNIWWVERSKARRAMREESFSE
ncbi:50S ribosomal protein L15 [Frankliniella fusca]|uniref:50S ribosomal protein L15 n=1 Tax=Frankliniella fusca TaxID=407009 RepID=A0AAE1LGB4_9NEOP|nr:50S ribosomal protein L15 [Frankliniella fusca]